MFEPTLSSARSTPSHRLKGVNTNGYDALAAVGGDGATPRSGMAAARFTF
jgi:hypothetical protein